MGAALCTKKKEVKKSKFMELALQRQEDSKKKYLTNDRTLSPFKGNPTKKILANA